MWKIIRICGVAFILFAISTYCLCESDKMFSFRTSVKRFVFILFLWYWYLDFEYDGINLKFGDARWIVIAFFVLILIGLTIMWLNLLSNVRNLVISFINAILFLGVAIIVHNKQLKKNV